MDGQRYPGCPGARYQYGRIQHPDEGLQKGSDVLIAWPTGNYHSQSMATEHSPSWSVMTVRPC